MATEISVAGRLVAPNLVELEHPLTDVIGQVTVTAQVDLSPEEKNAGLRALLERLKSRPPGGRTREDIEAQIREERDSWEDGR